MLFLFDMSDLRQIKIKDEVKEFEVRKRYQDFLCWLFPLLARFPKTQKFVLGEKIGKLALEILESLVVLQYIPSAARQGLLKELNLKLEIFRSLMYLAYQLKLIGKKGFLFQESKVNEVGRMAYGFVNPANKNFDNSNIS